MNYQKIYNNIIYGAKSRGLNKKSLIGYYEKHHIVPKCLDGSNDKENLVLLTAREHFIAHMLLCKIYPNNTNIIFSLWAMIHLKSNIKKREFKINSRMFQVLKEEFKRINSLTRRGNKSMSGKRHSEETKIKMRNSSKGRGSPMEGKTHSEETKKKYSKFRSGNLHPLYGKSTSIETRNKISSSLKLYFENKIKE